MTEEQILEILDEHLESELDYTWGDPYAVIVGKEKAASKIMEALNKENKDERQMP